MFVITDTVKNLPSTAKTSQKVGAYIHISLNDQLAISTVCISKEINLANILRSFTKAYHRLLLVTIVVYAITSSTHGDHIMWLFVEKAM